MSDVHHQSGARPRVGARFAEGLVSPWHGLGWLLSTPSAWGVALVPMVVFTVLVSLGTWGGVALVEHLLGPRLAHAEGWGLLLHVVRVLGWLAALTVAVLTALTLAQPLSGPALESLARRQGMAIGATPLPDTPFFEGMFRSLRVTLFGLLLTVPVVVGLTIVEIAVPVLVVVTVPLKFVATALMLAWDLLDYPLSLRAAGVRARLDWISRHFGAALGFGVSIAIIGLVPCAGLLFLPAGVAGATRLVALADRH
ncbi:MAG: EI24 domain-containing protein [Deltaproteobacteria bacterium]|nr:EI24 domain-containing protein [Deltaproteobacteria bacterium]